MTETAEIPGQLAPNEDRTARLSAPARARVVAVNVRIGDRVSRGQPLVTLQSEQATSARAEYAKALVDVKAHQVAATYATLALERAERLLALKAVSRQDVERARVEREEAESTRAQAEVDVERARGILDQLGVDPGTGDMALRSPIAGVVLSRAAVPGSVVEPGAELVLVTDPTTLWLEMAATERIAPALRRGYKVSFTVTELPGVTLDATIENVGAALEPSTRTLPVHGVVRNVSGALRPAMFATVTVPLGEARVGVAVADGALQLLDGRSAVFVARPGADGSATFELRAVEIGARGDGRVHVVRGLRAGDLVVTEGAYAVKSEVARTVRAD
jgi:cobalt-zinc-cadmium efflux system membrane fusion protein